ncbi:MAG: AEC family transporter [bacterium]
MNSLSPEINSGEIVLLKIAGMFLVMLIGWAAARRRVLRAETTSLLSRLVVDLALPALVFTQMLATVEPARLRTDLWIPFYGFALMPGSLLAAMLVGRLRGLTTDRRTFRFLIAVPNWIFLPLPIAEAMYGGDGTRFVLLCNIGAQLGMWTFGVGILSGTRMTRAALRGLALNSGLLSAILGIAAACVWPAGRLLVLGAPPTDASFGLKLIATFIDAARMVGSVTIPLALLITGAQLAGLSANRVRPSLGVLGVLAGRLVVAPLLAMGFVHLGMAVSGVTLPEWARLTAYLIAAMPTGVSCAMFVERFGGDRELGALGILHTTLASFLTVPGWVWVWHATGW